MSGEVIRNLDAFPGMFPGMRVFSRMINNSELTAKNYTIETWCQHIFCAIGISKDEGDAVVTTPTIVPGKIEASTTFVGTKKVTFAIPADDDLFFLVIGSMEIASKLVITADTTETGPPDQ